MNEWSAARIKYYDHDFYNLNKDEEYPVLGILLFSSRELFVVYDLISVPRASLYDSALFYISDSQLPGRWRIDLHISHQQMTHGGLDFSDFNYIGIDRYVNEQDFYEKYFDGSDEQVRFIEKELQLSES